MSWNTLRAMLDDGAKHPDANAVLENKVAYTYTISKSSNPGELTD